jgi:hypothetical protein
MVRGCGTGGRSCWCSNVPVPDAMWDRPGVGEDALKMRPRATRRWAVVLPTCATERPRPPPRVPLHYAGVGGPNQVVSASGSPGPVSSPTQATCPSGRDQHGRGGGDLAQDGELPHPDMHSVDQLHSSRPGVMSNTPGSPRFNSTGRASCSKVNTRSGPSAVTRSRSGMRRPSSGWPSPRPLKSRRALSADQRSLREAPLLAISVCPTGCWTRRRAPVWRRARACDGSPGFEQRL